MDRRRKDNIARWLLVACLPLATSAPTFAQDTTIRTIAGNGAPGFSGDSGHATSARIAGVFDSASDASGNLFLPDYHNHRIRRVDAATGIITTLAGTGEPAYNGDGIPATEANIYQPLGIALDAAGNIYVTEYQGGRVRRIDAASGLISTIAGTGTPSGSTGNGGPATAATFRDIYGIAVDSRGNVYIADRDASQVRRIDAASGIIDAWVTGVDSWNLALDASDNLYVPDPFGNRVIRTDPDGTSQQVVAGGGFDPGEDVPATTASLLMPTGVALDAAGNVFIAEWAGFRIRRVDAQTGLIRTIAGTGTYGYGGDGGPAAQATFGYLAGVDVDPLGRVVVPDSDNFRIRAFGGDPVTTWADLSVTSAALAPLAPVGDALRFGVTVANAGPDAATYPGVAFALDAALPDLGVVAPPDWSCDTPTAGEGTSVVACAATGLPASADATFLLTGTVPASELGNTITLAAAATSLAGDPDTANNMDSDGIAIVEMADLSVTMAGPLISHTGGTANYAVTVRNAGPSVADQPVVVVTADVPWSTAMAHAPTGWQCVRRPSGNFEAICTAQAGSLATQPVAFGVQVAPFGAGFPRRYAVGAGVGSDVHDPDAANNAAAVRTVLTR